MVPATVKSIALIVACTVMTGLLYGALPSSWCGSCPARSFTIPGTDGRLKIVDWRLTTWICFGDEHMDVPIPVPVAVMGTVGLLLITARLCREVARPIEFFAIAAAAAVFTGVLTSMVSGTTKTLAVAMELPGATMRPLSMVLLVGVILLAVALVCMVWFELPRMISTRKAKYL
jgi:hypothetical protein